MNDFIVQSSLWNLIYDSKRRFIFQYDKYVKVYMCISIIVSIDLSIIMSPFKYVVIEHM